MKKGRNFNREWFNEECRQLLEQKNKAYQAYLARPVRAKRAECEERRKWLIQHGKRKKKQDVNQQLLWKRNLRKETQD